MDAAAVMMSCQSFLRQKQVGIRPINYSIGCARNGINSLSCGGRCGGVSEVQFGILGAV